MFLNARLSKDVQMLSQMSSCALLDSQSPQALLARHNTASSIVIVDGHTIMACTIGA